MSSQNTPLSVRIYADMSQRVYLHLLAEEGEIVTQFGDLFMADDHLRRLLDLKLHLLEESADWVIPENWREAARGQLENIPRPKKTVRSLSVLLKIVLGRPTYTLRVEGARGEDYRVLEETDMTESLLVDRHA